MNFKLRVYYGLNIYFSGCLLFNSIGLQDIATSPLVPFLPLVSPLKRTFPKLNSVWMTAVANHLTFCSLLAIWWSSIHPRRYWPSMTDSEIYMGLLWHQFSSIQSLSRVWLFATPWIAVHQASPSITNSRSSPKLMSIESVMPSSHLILCRPLLLLPSIPPASGSFPMSQLFPSGGQNIGVSASASVPPMNTQDWSPLEWTGWISLQSKGLSRVFSNTTVQKHQFFGAQLSSQSSFHIYIWPLEKQ